MEAYWAHTSTGLRDPALFNLGTAQQRSVRTRQMHQALRASADEALLIQLQQHRGKLPAAMLREQLRSRGLDHKGDKRVLLRRLAVSLAAALAPARLEIDAENDLQSKQVVMMAHAQAQLQLQTERQAELMWQPSPRRTTPRPATARAAQSSRLIYDVPYPRSALLPQPPSQTPPRKRPGAHSRPFADRAHAAAAALAAITPQTACRHLGADATAAATAAAAAVAISEAERASMASRPGSARVSSSSFGRPMSPLMMSHDTMDDDDDDHDDDHDDEDDSAAAAAAAAAAASLVTGAADDDDERLPSAMKLRRGSSAPRAKGFASLHRVSIAVPPGSGSGSSSQSNSAASQRRSSVLQAAHGRAPPPQSAPSSASSARRRSSSHSPGSKVRSRTASIAPRFLEDSERRSAREQPPKPKPPQPAAETAAPAPKRRVLRVDASKLVLAAEPTTVRTGLWRIVRELLWRIVDPSAGFAHMVRRALFTQRMVNVLRAMPAFGSASTEQLAAMVSSGAEIFLGRYKALYREGAAATNVYILLDGTLGHSSSTSTAADAFRVQEVKPRPPGSGRGGFGGADGVDGLPVGTETLTNVSRLTTATAISDCRLLQLSSSDLGLSRDAVMREFVRGELREIPLFHGDTAETFEKMVPLVAVIEVDHVGLSVIHSGVVPSAFCILVHGAVDVILAGGDCVARLPAHAAEAHNSYPFFGEMGLLTNQPAVASVRCHTACKFLTVSRQNFARFLNLVPDFEKRVKAFADMRAKQNEILREQQLAALEKEAAQAAVRDANALLIERQIKRRSSLARAATQKLPPALASTRASNRQSLEPERPAIPTQNMVSMMAAALGRAQDAPA